MKKEKKPNICCVYIITSPDNKSYIGGTTNLIPRLRSYKCLRVHHQVKVQEQLELHGWDSFKVEILIQCKECELDDYERFYIKKYDTYQTEHGLNLTTGGKRGFKQSEEMKMKNTLSHLGVEPSEKAKLNQASYWKGKTIPKEAVEKRQQSRIENNGSLNHKEQTKQKISDTLRKRWEEKKANNTPWKKAV